MQQGPGRRLRTGPPSSLIARFFRNFRNEGREKRDGLGPCVPNFKFVLKQPWRLS